MRFTKTIPFIAAFYCLLIFGCNSSGNNNANADQPNQEANTEDTSLIPPKANVPERTIKQIIEEKNQQKLKPFWSEVSYMYQSKQMSEGIQAMLYGIAKHQTNRMSEIFAMMENIENEPSFQESIMQVICSKNNCGEFSRQALASMCGSHKLANPVSDYYCENFSNK